MGLPEVDGLTPGTDLMGASALIEEDELGDDSVEAINGEGTMVANRFEHATIEGKEALLTSLAGSGAAHLPHSSSSYDLRSRAITPGTSVPMPDKGVSRASPASS